MPLYLIGCTIGSSVEKHLNKIIKQINWKREQTNVDPKPNLRDNSYKLNKQLNINQTKRENQMKNTKTATSTKATSTKATATKATATSTKKPAVKKVVSKKAQSVKIVTRMLNRKKIPARKVIITELMNKADLSANGAATYYQNVVSGKWV